MQKLGRINWQKRFLPAWVLICPYIRKTAKFPFYADRRFHKQKHPLGSNAYSRGVLYKFSLVVRMNGGADTCLFFFKAAQRWRSWTKWVWQPGWPQLSSIIFAENHPKSAGKRGERKVALEGMTQEWKFTVARSLSFLHHFLCCFWAPLPWHFAVCGFWRLSVGCGAGGRSSIPKAVNGCSCAIGKNYMMRQEEMVVILPIAVFNKGSTRKLQW